MPEKNKPIRSYVRRQGRMTPGQNKAYELLWPKYGIELDNQKVEFEIVFDRNAPAILEIGFGMGEALLQLAEKNPQNNYLGVDVHKPGVGAVLMGIEKKSLKNLRVFNADAIDVLNQRIPNDSLTGVHLFFPDPWHKKRHHKRRIVTESFAQLIRSKLKLEGYLHMATDWQDYAEQMMSVMSLSQGFINMAGQAQFIPRPKTRPFTRFEQRGERLGHDVWDLMFIRED